MKYRALDAWRGVCAVLVMLFHLGAAGHFHSWSVIRHGGMGVTFFFVLSGFVITHAYKASLTTGSASIRFIIRRFGRLYPLHFATLGALFALELIKLALVTAGIHAGDAPFTETNSWTSLLGNLALINGLGFFNIYTWNGPSWSISTEFYTYLIFLSVCVLAKRIFIPIAVAIIALTAGAIWLNSTSAHPLGPIRGMGFIACILCFFTGSVTYTIHKTVSVSARILSFAEVPTFLLVLAAFWIHNATFTTLSPYIFAATIFVFASESGPISALFLTSAPQHLGKISYSLYMVHFPLLEFMNGFARAIQQKMHLNIYSNFNGDSLLSIGGPWAMDVLAILYVLAVIIISTLTFRYIEDPARRWFNRRSDMVVTRAPQSLPLRAGSEKADYV